MASEISWQQLLQQQTALDLVREKNRPVIEIEAGTSIEDALKVGYYDCLSLIGKILASNNIISAPVKEESTILGFVDVLDLSGYILAQYRRHSVTLWKDLSATSTEDFLKHPVKSLISSGTSFDDLLSDYSQWDDPVIVLEHSSVHVLIEALASASRHFIPHRVAVINTENKLTNVISQSDLILFLNKHMHSLPLSAV
jgi:CBS-domain-containing membrane protein